MNQAPSPPIRTCIGCRQTKPAPTLVRLTLVDGPALDIDPVTAVGRGSWLCRQVACAELAGERRAFSRAFRQKTPDSRFAASVAAWLSPQPGS